MFPNCSKNRSSKLLENDFDLEKRHRHEATPIFLNDKIEMEANRKCTLESSDCVK